MGTRGIPTPACRAMAVLTALPEAPLSKLGGVEAGPPGSEHALCTQPSYGRTGGLLGAMLPASLKQGLARISVWCDAAWAWINDKGPQIKQTSTAVFPGFPHTQIFQVLFFCLNRGQRAELLWAPGGDDRSTLASSHSEQLSPTLWSGQEEANVGRWGRSPCPGRGRLLLLPCVG